MQIVHTKRCGGNGGAPFDDTDLAIHGGRLRQITRIEIYADYAWNCVGSIRLVYGFQPDQHEVMHGRQAPSSPPVESLLLDPNEYVSEACAVGHIPLYNPGTSVYPALLAVKFVTNRQRSVQYPKYPKPFRSKGPRVGLPESPALRKPQLAFVYGTAGDVVNSLGFAWVDREALEAAAALGSGEDDAAAVKDSLDFGPAARGAATFLLNPNTSAMTMSVYGPWGSGKSSFMKLVEREMHLQAALEQLDVIEPTDNQLEEGTQHQRYNDLYQTLYDPKTPDARLNQLFHELQALSSPRLMTVWFNAWQYLNEDQVWGGLVVEVTQRIEEKLGPQQRSSMRPWWPRLSRPWFKLLLTPMGLLTAFSYNWRTRKSAILLQCVLPVLAVLLVVAVLVWVGVSELLAQSTALPPSSESANNNGSQGAGATNQVVKAAQIAAVVVSGSVVGLLAVCTGTMTNIKSISTLMMEVKAFFRFKDHQDKIGYQHAVKKDLLALRQLVHERLAGFHKLNHTSVWSLQRPPKAEQQEQRQGRNQQQQPQGPAQRIVVFIDDLDRCKHTKVVEVLEAINIVLAGSGFSVVVGMDKRFIVNAVAEAYEGPLVDADKADEFLNKIVQVELTLPHPSRRELAQYLKGLGIVVKVQDPIASPSTSFQTRTSQTDADGPSASAPAASSSNMAKPGRSAETRSTGAADTDDRADQEANPGASSDSVPAPAPPSASGTPSQPPASRFRQSKLRYKGQEKDYPKPAKEALETILNAGLLDGVTPRQIKRLLNRYLLAKYIIMAQIEHQEEEIRQAAEGTIVLLPWIFGDTEERKLMGWLLLWWKYPAGMSLVLQHVSRHRSRGLLKVIQGIVALLDEDHPDSNPEITGGNRNDGKCAKEPGQPKQITEARTQVVQMNTLLMGAMGNEQQKQLWDLEPELIQRFKLFGQEYRQ